jgi:hypothetical protein
MEFVLPGSKCVDRGLVQVEVCQGIWCRSTSLMWQMGWSSRGYCVGMLHNGRVLVIVVVTVRREYSGVVRSQSQRVVWGGQENLKLKLKSKAIVKMVFCFSNQLT